MACAACFTCTARHGCKQKLLTPCLAMQGWYDRKENTFRKLVSVHEVAMSLSVTGQASLTMWAYLCFP